MATAATKCYDIRKSVVVLIITLRPEWNGIVDGFGFTALIRKKERKTHEERAEEAEQ